MIISLKFNWINCTCFGNFNLTKAFLCPGFNVSWTVAVRYSIWMESFPVAVMCFWECLRAQCWVLFWFCSTLWFSHTPVDALINIIVTNWPFSGSLILQGLFFCIGIIMNNIFLLVMFVAETKNYRHYYSVEEWAAACM